MKLLRVLSTVAVLGLAAAVAPVMVAKAADPTLQAVRVPGAGPILDPFALVWENVQPVHVTMQPQTAATPMNPNHAISDLQARFVHNGEWLAVLLQWKDATKNDRLVVDQFGDQVAVEFPVHYKPSSLPSPMMGNPGDRVNILQWRAVFQADLERKHDLAMRDLYPNAMSDLYPEQVLRVLDVRPYTGAVGVDNPVAKHRESPVLDQMAEGFGSLTVKSHQFGDGRGVWRDGMWHVVITTPMNADGANGPRFVPGDQTVTAFALWDGSHREVGARKSWSDWVPLSIAK